MTLVLSRDQVRRIDELAGSRYHIPGLLLMENAGRNAASIIDRSYGPKGRSFILCGPGNNGGDGLVIARHLHIAGWAVRGMLTADESRFTPDTSVNYSIVKAMGLDVPAVPDASRQGEVLRSAGPDAVIIDALLGTGFAGELRGSMLTLIQMLNAIPRRAVAAIDVPSGLECDTGRPCPEAVRADLTVTFVAMKPGLSVPTARSYAGRVEVADIGVPRELIDEVADGGP